VTKAIMFLGTGSDVGKSLIVAGLARAFVKRGLKVAPFKPQNMSNNAAIAIEGGEIGRAQHLQARAAKIAPSVHMNPILLKPESDIGAQVIVQGKRKTTLKARDFFRERMQFMPAILESFQTLAKNYDLILVEGAGSPAEANLRNGDLANMGFAAAADIPAILIGDIHRGGVIASLIGTKAVLDGDDVARIKGFLINKFHGDPELFSEGRDMIVSQTGWPCFGVVPHFPAARKLPAEDAVALEETTASDSKGVKICVLQLSRIANFDDMDPLRQQPGVSLIFLKPGEPIPGDTKLVIIPGSKSTISDLDSVRIHGWDVDINAHIRRGGYVLGLCGGYQMLGRTIADPEGIEGKPQTVDGLGLLDVDTVMTREKTTTLTEATHIASCEKISAYEIHIGSTDGPDRARPFSRTAAGNEGAISANGRVMGTYLHGCFSADKFRESFLTSLGSSVGHFAYEDEIEATLDALAAHLETHLDLDAILKAAKQIS